MGTDYIACRTTWEGLPVTQHAQSVHSHQLKRWMDCLAESVVWTRGVCLAPPKAINLHKVHKRGRCGGGGGRQVSRPRHTAPASASASPTSSIASGLASATAGRGGAGDGSGGAALRAPTAAKATARGEVAGSPKETGLATADATDTCAAALSTEGAPEGPAPSKAPVLLAPVDDGWEGSCAAGTSKGLLPKMAGATGAVGTIGAMGAAKAVAPAPLDPAGPPSA